MGQQVEGLELMLRKAQGRARRLLRWEFWPTWAVYAPLVPHFAWLALRHGDVRVAGLANPSIPLAGLAGESKWHILNLLPRDATLPAVLIPRGEVDARFGALRAHVEASKWPWPIVLKPDIGERGSAVALVRSWTEARAYLTCLDADVLAQAYDPGPHEAGIFYARRPKQTHGFIFAITLKQLSHVTGDGVSTIRTLIYRDRLLRPQARALLASIGAQADDVPAAGQSITLGFAGNHARGAIFTDGARHITPELTRVIDDIARRSRGVFFGRFDVRYSQPDDLAAGRNLRVIEFNGLASEATNIYDPANSFWNAQRTLRAQWRLAFEIGAAQRRVLPPDQRALAKPSEIIAGLRRAKHAARSNQHAAERYRAAMKA